MAVGEAGRAMRRQLLWGVTVAWSAPMERHGWQRRFATGPPGPGAPPNSYGSSS